MVVDTSVILAIFFDEPHANWAAHKMVEHGNELCMSTVNLSEALIRIKDRQSKLYLELEDRLMSGGIRFISPDIEQAQIAAEARLKFPLNLGDCFVYALACSTRFGYSYTRF